jgi:localization factor PodJL
MNRPLYRNAKASNQDVSRQRRSSGRRGDSRRDDWRDFDADRAFDDDESDDDFDAIDDAPHASEDDDDPFEGVARRAARARRRAALDAERDRAREPSADEIAANAAALVSKRVSESERQTARALQNLTELIETGQRKLESSVIDRAVNSLEKRVVQSERYTAQALENIADIVERGRQNAVDPVAIEVAVSAFDRRVGESERKTAKALESIAEMISTEAKSRSRGHDGFDVLLDRLGRIESKLAQPPAEPSPPRSKPAPPVAPRAERASIEPRSPEFESALSGLDRRLAELAAKLDADSRREPRHSASTASPRALDRALEAGGARSARPLADAILDITRRQAALDGPPAPAPAPASAPPPRASERRPSLPFDDGPDFAASLAGKRFDELQEAVAALSRKMESLQGGDGDRGEQMLAMTRQIESLRRQIDEASRGENPAVAKRFDELRTLVENLARKIEANASDKRFDELQQGIGVLTKRMESLRSAEGDRSDQLLVLTRQIELLRGQIDDAGRGEPVELGGRFAELRQVVDQLARQSEAMREEIGENAERQQKISRQVENLREEIGESVERQNDVSRQIGDLRHEIAELSQSLGDLAPRASIASIETALRELIEHIGEQRRQGVADDALAPAERVAGELRAVLNDMDPAPRVQSLDVDLRRMAERIDELHAPGEANAATLRDLTRQTEEIKQILSALISRPLPLEQIESRLQELTQRVDRLSQSPQGPRGQRGAERVGDVTEAAKSIRAIIAAESEGNLNAFNQRLDRLSDKLEQALTRFGGKNFDELGARIDDMHRSIAQRLDRSATQKGPDTSALENLVAGLAKKIDAALESSSSRRGVEALEGKVERIHQKLDRIDFPSTNRIEELLTRNQPQQQREMRAIGERLDEMHKALNARVGSGDVQAQLDQIREISDRLEAMHGSLSARLEKGVRSLSDPNDLQEQHKQLRQISERLDALCGVLATRIDEISRERTDSLDAQQQQKHFAELSERLDFMHHALAARIEEGARQRSDASRAQLTDLVEQLARHTNSAMEPNADPEQVNALGEQLRDLTIRLDRGGEGAALASIETKIAELFARIEETRASATEAAEEAVRRATLDVLRQAGGALGPSVKEELDDIRLAQTENGARTHETLSAVHDTLERVVDRLAVFEEELSDIRATGAPPAPLAAPHDEPRVAPPRAEPLAARAKERVEPQIAVAATAPAPAPRMRRGRDVDDLDLSAIGTTTSSRGVEPDTAVQANFIAAARRAAERAAADADRKERDELAVEPPPRRAAAAGGGGAAGEVATPSGVVASIAARKRPIILGLTGVVLVVAALQLMPFIHLPGKSVARNDAHGAAEQGQSAQDKIVAPAGPLGASGQKETTPAPSKTGVSVPDAGEPARMPTSAAKPDGKNSLSEHVDQTPVGAIDRSTNVAQEPTSVQALAARGDANAQYEMGVRFAEGRAGSPRDAKTAAEWFGKAASQGMPLAQYRLGSFYEKGIGVERNTERARVLYQQAAEAGNARAMHNLGVLSVEGNDGKPDYANAALWFRKAAEYGVRDSQFNLAILYARGLGVDQSLVQSYLWFSVAAGQGDADAAKKRDDVGARLDTHDMATAKALVESFKAKELKRDANEAEPARNNWQGFSPPATPQLPPLMSPRPKVSRM